VPGVLHGNRTYLLQDEDGQIIETHSVSAGLAGRRPGARLAEGHRPRRVSADHRCRALEAFHKLCRLEGIIPALESSHALAYAAKLAPTLARTRFCWSTSPAG
jgi:tryptophan synthase beta chain